MPFGAEAAHDLARHNRAVRPLGDDDADADLVRRLIAWVTVLPDTIVSGLK